MIIKSPYMVCYLKSKGSSASPDSAKPLMEGVLTYGNPEDSKTSNPPNVIWSERFPLDCVAILLGQGTKRMFGSGRMERTLIYVIQLPAQVQEQDAKFYEEHEL